MKKRFQNTPIWVLPALASATIIFQGAPPIFAANEIINEKTEAFVSLVCDLSNLLFAAATFFFTKSSQK